MSPGLGGRAGLPRFQGPYFYPATLSHGIGTLDPDTLALVAETLLSLCVGGRMVGIITHIPELRDEFAQQVIVNKRQGYSTVETAGGRRRRDLRSELLQNLRMQSGDLDERFRRARRLPTALLPILQRSNRHTHQSSKRCL